MVFQVQSINKNKGTYLVASDTGEQQWVRAEQIVNVLLQGFKFTNAHLTGRGFAIETPKGTRYVQLKNMTKELEATIKQRIAYDKNLEDQAKTAVEQQEKMVKQVEKEQAKRFAEQEKQRVQARPRAKAVAKAGSDSAKIGNNINNTITYRGKTYLSAATLCKEYNRDLNEFKQLIQKGYSIPEALGVQPLRPESELPKSKERMSKVLDSMESKRGN